MKTNKIFKGGIIMGLIKAIRNSYIAASIATLESFMQRRNTPENVYNAMKVVREYLIDNYK